MDGISDICNHCDWSLVGLGHGLFGAVVWAIRSIIDRWIKVQRAGLNQIALAICNSHDGQFRRGIGQRAAVSQNGACGAIETGSDADALLVRGYCLWLADKTEFQPVVGEAGVARVLVFNNTLAGPHQIQDAVLGCTGMGNQGPGADQAVDTFRIDAEIVALHAQGVFLGELNETSCCGGKSQFSDACIAVFDSVCWWAAQITAITVLQQTDGGGIRGGDRAGAVNLQPDMEGCLARVRIVVDRHEQGVLGIGGLLHIEGNASAGFAGDFPGNNPGASFRQ
ncbi:hypothetical protein D3C72_1332580 [compost metagenome]